jgi:uncharacterized protein with PQ loop repeat
MIQLIGYLGLALLMMACIPQAVKTIKQGHSDGMTAFYLISLVVAFIILIIYMCLYKILVPIFINYIINLISYSIMTYYKFFPRKQNDGN